MLKFMGILCIAFIVAIFFLGGISVIVNNREFKWDGIVIEIIKLIKKCREK